MVRIFTTDRAPQLLELTRVKTRRVLSQGSNSVPAGTVGTVVFVYDDGSSFEVEFPACSSVVLTAKRADLDFV